MSDNNTLFSYGKFVEFNGIINAIPTRSEYSATYDNHGVTSSDLGTGTHRMWR